MCVQRQEVMDTVILKDTMTSSSLLLYYHAFPHLGFWDSALTTGSYIELCPQRGRLIAGWFHGHMFISKFIRLYTLIKYSFLCYNYTSIKWELFSKKRGRRLGSFETMAQVVTPGSTFVIRPRKLEKRPSWHHSGHLCKTNSQPPSWG